MELLTQDINPRLLRSNYFDGMEELEMIPRTIYDYEFEYFIRSSGGIIVDSEYIPYSAGDVSVKKPGQVIQGIAPYEVYIINFRLDGVINKRENYIFGWPDTASPRYRNKLLDTLADKISLQDHPHIGALFNELYIVSQKHNELDQFQVNSILYTILYELFRLSVPVRERKNSVNLNVIRAIDHIKIFYCENIDIGELIEKSKLSKAYFNKCFREYTGMTPMSMIISLRIQKAQNLLLISNNTISEISGLCGYYDQVYFTHLFHKRTGVSPSVYRKLRSYR